MLCIKYILHVCKRRCTLRFIDLAVCRIVKTLHVYIECIDLGIIITEDIIQQY